MTEGKTKPVMIESILAKCGECESFTTLNECFDNIPTNTFGFIGRCECGATNMVAFDYKFFYTHTESAEDRKERVGNLVGTILKNTNERLEGLVKDDNNQ